MNAALNGKRRALRLGTGLATCVSCIVFAQAAFGQALPDFANGAVAPTTVGTVMTVDALGANQVINWNTFSIAQGNTVNFVSTNVGVPVPVTVVNRVIGTTSLGVTTFTPSQINGTLTAADHVSLWLVNPSGIMFGNSGSFNGGSLVLSTLDFLDGKTGSEVFNSSIKTSLKNRDVVTDLTTVKLDLVQGNGAITSSGSVLLLGEQISVGKSVNSTGDVYIVAASDVRITTQAGSPVGYAFVAGTRLTGAKVLATGDVSGRNIVVAASNGTSQIADLLQTEAGGSLTAVSDGGTVTLLTSSNLIDPLAATGRANIRSLGAVATTGLNADVSVTSQADARVDSIVATGDIIARSGLTTNDSLTVGKAEASGKVDLRSIGDMALGTANGQRISAGSTITIRSDAGIQRGSDLVPPAGTATDSLAIRSYQNTALADGAISITAVDDINLGNARLYAGDDGIADLAIKSTAGSVTFGSASASRFTGTAFTTFDASGTISANNAAVGGPGAALSIIAGDDVTLGTARTSGADQDISIRTVGDIVAGTLDASRNLTISTSAAPALSFTATTLAADAGTITVNAGSMAVGSANAGLSVTLRSDGNIAFTGAITAGKTQPAGNVMVSGLDTTTTHAALFEAATVTATTGLVNIKANQQSIGRVVSDGGTTLNGAGAITLGSAAVGTDLNVTSTLGNIRLGKPGAQRIGADGKVTITATAGEIFSVNGPDALTIVANADDGATADALTIKALSGVDLGNATLLGGNATTAPISVQSVESSVAIGAARGTRITGTAATTFDASGAISANGANAATGNTISITGLTGITLADAVTGGTGENIVLTSDGPISVGTVTARNNLTIASLDNPAVSIAATALEAVNGALSAYAQSMDLGTVEAGTTVNLRASGAIEAGTFVRAGTNLTVSGLTPPGAGAGAFKTPLAEAITGNISVNAGATDIATALSGVDTSVTGATAILGKVTAGRTSPLGKFTVATSGLITLGTAANQTQSATGAISITSTGGAIEQGATGLTLTANDDGMGTETLTLNAGNAITLGGAALNGGRDSQSDVVLMSGTATPAATTINKVNAADFTANSTGAFTANGAIIADGKAAITANAAVMLNTVTTTVAGSDITITTPGSITVTTLQAERNVTAGAPASGNAAAFSATTVKAQAGTIAINAGATDIGTAESGTDTKIAGDSAILGAVTAGTTSANGKLTVATTGLITLGKAANQTQSATGGITLESTDGAIEQGAAGLKLTANSDGLGTEALTLKAGTAILLGDATLNGSWTKKSDVTLQSGTSTTIGRANAADFTANTGLAFTAKSDIATKGNVAITASGSVALKDVTASEADHSITITTPGAATADRLTAQRDVTVGGSTISFTAGAVEATDGAISVAAKATDIGSAQSGGNTTVTGTSAVLGSIKAGTASPLGKITVLTSGDVTLGKLANQMQSATGAISIESTAGSIQQGATGLTLTANSDGLGTETLSLKAAKSISLAEANLNGGQNRQSHVSLVSGLDTSIGGAAGKSITAIAGRNFTANREITATDDVALTAAANLTADAALTAGNSVKLSAKDATIGSAISAKTIDVFNTGSGALLIGGDAEAVAGKFTLSRVEAGRLKASETLTLGADGTDDVEIKQVDFSEPKTVRVLAQDKRIDVTGAISFDSGITLKLGGDVATGAGNASLIQIAADSGGRIAGADGRLELGANNIVVGNDALIKRIDDASTASGKLAEALRMNLQTGSPLYNGGEGQAVLVRAGSMKVNFTGYALFQNTGTSLLGQGVSLGTPGGSKIALDIASPTAQPVFAMFGSVNGIINNATALLGNPPLAHYQNITSSRLNGCVIGGGNCLSVQNLTPSLSALDSVRTSIFTVKPDFQVPFDPLVGTNNDALFDDVGSFGLGELPMAPIECTDPSGACSTQKKDGK